MEKKLPGKEYLWNPADYARRSPAQKQWAEELIGKIALEGSERVLDIGCGDGVVTAAIAERVPLGTVVGIDSSSDMIQFASNMFPGNRYPNLSFMEGDARALLFSSEFDVVFSNAALHWVNDHGPVVAGISRALRSGGRMVVQMGGKGNAAQVFEALDKLLAQSRWNEYFSNFSFHYGFYSPAEYCPWLVAAGLCPVRVELIQKDMAYPDPEGFSGWFRTTWMPYLERIPEDRQESFIRDITDQFLDLYPPDASGAIHVKMMRLEVEAVKP